MNDPSSTRDQTGRKNGKLAASILIRAVPDSYAIRVSLRLFPAGEFRGHVALVAPRDDRTLSPSSRCISSNSPGGIPPIPLGGRNLTIFDFDGSRRS